MRAVSTQDQLDGAITQVAQQDVGRFDSEMESHSRIAIAHSINHCRCHRQHWLRRSNPKFTDGGVGQGFYLAQAAPKLIEYRGTSFQQRVSECRGNNALGSPIEQGDPQ